MNDLFKVYMGTIEDNDKSICRASMFKLMDYLTNHDEAVLTDINYVSAILINEPRKLLQDIINKKICPSKQKHLTHLLENWLIIPLFPVGILLGEWRW